MAVPPIPAGEREGSGVPGEPIKFLSHRGPGMLPALPMAPGGSSSKGQPEVLQHLQAVGPEKAPKWDVGQEVPGKGGPAGLPPNPKGPGGPLTNPKTGSNPLREQVMSPTHPVAPLPTGGGDGRQLGFDWKSE